MYTARILKIIILTMLLSACSNEQAVPVVHFIKFEWKTEKNSNDFYELSSNIYESFETSGITLYAKYNNFNGVYALMDAKFSDEKIANILSDSLKHKATIFVDDNNLEQTPLHRLLDETVFGEKAECLISQTKTFANQTEAQLFISKFKSYSARRGYPIGIKASENSAFNHDHLQQYNMQFDFIGQCHLKEKIITEIFKNIEN